MSRDLNVDQIKKLWVLDLIIQCGSLKKAAIQAKVSPSAISQSLTSLERSFGKPLLVRERGSITPTRDALFLLEIVRPAFAAFDQLKNFNRLPVPKLRWLNFGTYESIAIDVLPGLIQSLRERMPDLKLSLRIGRTSNLLTMVRKGELRSALITEVDDLDRFYVKEVSIDRLGLYTSKRLSLAQKNFSSLETLGFGGLSPGKDGLPRYYTRFIRQLEPSRPFILSESFEALRAAAVAGSLVAILPKRVALRNDDLEEILAPKKLKEIGEHRICVVSSTKSDPEETDFLAAEAGRLLNKSNLIGR